MKSFGVFTFFLVVLTTTLFSASALAEPQDSKSCLESEDSYECVASKRIIAELELKATFASVRLKSVDTFAQFKDEKSKQDAKEIDRRLVAAQIAWVTARDTGCLLQGAMALGGKIESQIIMGCLLDRTLSRSKELRELEL